MHVALKTYSVKKQATRDNPTKITQDTKKVTIVDLSGSKNKLTQNMYIVWNVRSSGTKVNKTPYNVTTTSRILKRLTISRCKMNIEIHGSLSSPVISKRSSIEKILNILLLRQKEPLIRGGDLNPKKVPQMTKIRHKKLITKTSLNESASSPPVWVLEDWWPTIRYLTLCWEFCSVHHPKRKYKRWNKFLYRH
jgi:hypothetical protein